MYKIVSVRYESVIQKFFFCTPNHKSVPTALHVTSDILLIGCFAHVPFKHDSRIKQCFFCFGVTQTINRECAKPLCFLFLVSCFLTLVCGGPKGNQFWCNSFHSNEENYMSLQKGMHSPIETRSEQIMLTTNVH